MTVSGGLQHVPLSPWGYWSQMSKLENLSDFPLFDHPRLVLCSVYRQVERLKALLHKGLRCSVKKWKTSGLLGGKKVFYFLKYTII